MTATKDLLTSLVSGSGLPAMSTGQKGSVPPTGTPSGKYLKDDGTWAAVAGGGDMTKVVYDPNEDGVVALAQLDTGVSTFKQSNHDALPNPHHVTTNDPTTDQKAALAGTSGAPSVTNKFVTNDDTRNSDARTPTTHGHAEADVTNLVTDLGNKQATLVSGTNIKTINSASVLGAGDLVVTGSPPSWYGVLYSNQNDCNPNEALREWNMLAVAGPTPTGITVSLARAVMFTPPANMTCIKVRLFGVGVTTNLYKFAIYPVGVGSTKLWDSGTVTTAANTWLNIVTNFNLTAGTQYWFCVTAVTTGTTAGFRSMPAPLGTNFWGANVAPVGARALSISVYVQFVVASGVFPGTLPAVAAAAYAAGTTGTVPFALLDSIA